MWHIEALSSHDNTEQLAFRNLLSEIFLKVTPL